MQLLKPEEPLASKVVRSGAWLISLRILEKILGLIRLVILARLLAPNDFGLFGIALLTISTVETFSQTGFQTALVQKKGNITDYLDSAWTVSVLRSIILFTILFLSAPYVLSFFDSSAPPLIIQVISISILFQGFNNIGIVYFQKELEFNKLVVYRLCSTLAYFVISITAALILRNVWALAYGILAEGLTGLITSYLIHPYRPRFHFDLKKMKELFGFGKWVFGSTILIFLITQGDDIFVGKMLGVAALGFYQMAYRISNIPATEITHVISQVTFPAYSKMQDNLPRLRESYLRVLQFTTFLSFPIAGLIFTLAPDFTKIFLGEKWMPMVPAMQVLCIFGLTRSIGATMGPILYSLGRPKLQTKLSSIQLIAMAVIIYPLTIRWGILGTSLSVVIPNIIALLMITITVKNIIGLRYNDFFMVLIVPFVAVLIMLLVILLIPFLLPFGTNILNSSILAIISSIVYLLIIFLWDKNAKNKMRYSMYGVFKTLIWKS